MRIPYPALLLLALVAALPFARALGGEFVHYDDYRTVVENEHWRGLDGDSLRWMFGSFYNGHYHPLTWLSFAVDHALWGLDPRGFHLTNLVLHALNAVLVAVVLRAVMQAASRSDEGAASVDVSATRSGLLAAVMGALFFAWHPLRVESVVWVTERRDLLSSFFWLATLACYLRAHTHAREHRARWLAAAFVLFVLSLLSKAWGITLPVVLLLLDARPLRRRLSTRLVLEKLPFIALAGLFAFLAAGAQTERAALNLDQHSVGSRVMQAAWGAVFYPWRTLVPIGQSPLHPIANVDFGALRFVVAAVLAVALPTALVLLRRTNLLIGWAVYLVVVAPVLGLLQSGPQLVAERYSYLSCVPFALGFAVLVSRARLRSRSRAIGTAAAAIALATYAALAFSYTPVWCDSISLWSRVIERYPENFRSHLGLAGTLYSMERPAEAADSYRRCTELSPELYEPWAMLTRIELERGNHDAALDAGRRAYRTNAIPESMLLMARVNAALGRQRLVLEFCAQVERSPQSSAAERRLAGELSRAADAQLGL